MIGWETIRKTLDEVVRAWITITVGHHEVHEGHAYEAGYYDNAIADSASIILHILTGGYKAHMQFIAACGGDATIQWKNRVNVDGNGTALTALSLNEVHNRTQTTQVFHTPTNPAGGFGADPMLLPGGTGGNAGGGQVRKDFEHILKPNSSYTITLTNISGVAKPGSIHIQWYEED